MKLKLSKVFSRERNMQYFELWNKSDRKGLELIGQEIKNNLFLIMPRKQQGSVWYDEKEFEYSSKKLI